MSWTPRLTQLNNILADLIPFSEGITKFIKAANLKPQMIRFGGTALDIWCSVISEAEKQNKIKDLIIAVLDKYPDNPFLKSALNANEINYSLSHNIDKSISWNPIEKETLEVLTSKVNTLLPINFLTKGINASKSVAKVEIKKGSITNVGTGFLFKLDTFDDLFFMTNHHVVSSEDDIANTRIIFNYEEDTNGNTKNTKSFKIDSNSTWYTSPVQKLDVTIFKLLATNEDLEEFEYLFLKKISIEKNNFVNIIQHPGGQFKQISLYHNIVTNVKVRIIQYLTDTMPGSSGSPVFNSSWEVVALHHSGGLRKKFEEKGDFKYRNEGIHINSIIDFLMLKLTNK